MTTFNIVRFLLEQPWVERLGWTLVHFLWQGMAIAVLYAIARRGSRDSQRRYLGACIALFAMLAAPIATFWLTGVTESPVVNPYIGTLPASSAAAAAASANFPATFSVVAAQVRGNNVMPWLVAVWFAGALIFLARLIIGCFAAMKLRSTQIRQAPPEWQRTLDDLRSRLRVSRPVRLLVSAMVQVPTVIGWLRPVVFMPVGALAGLPTEHVEALLAHELAHIRRHDYLVNILQSAVESLLFYHPAVWWISGHIRHERELCCDDIAVAASGDALTYAGALVDLESRRPAHFTPALAANGGSLPERIGHLLGQPSHAQRQFAGPGAIVAVLLIVVATCSVWARMQPPRAVFDAVSIKPNELGGGHSHSHTSTGRLDARMTTKSLIGMAFGIKSFQISGGPVWLDESNYDFIATTGDATTLNDKTLRQYLQSLLTDRFHLTYHRETKEFPVYELVAVKGSSKLTPHSGGRGESTSSHGNDEKIVMSGSDLSMAGMANFLAREVRRPVIDHTGIQGTYDVKLDWAPASLLTALQEQLGLRLSAAKCPVEILVVDSVEKPSEN